MPRYNERPARQSRFSEDDEPRSTSRRPSSSGRGSGRSTKKEQPKQSYIPIFALFGNDHAGGRMQIDVRTFQGEDQSIEDHLSLEEFLFFCEKLYYGETKLTGSMWECDEKYASMSGNVRFTEEQLEELKEEYEASAEGGTRREQLAQKKTKAKPAKTTRAKPRYEVPEEDEEDEEFEEIEVTPVKKKRTPVKPAVELDMETEEVGGEEATEYDANIPY